MGSRSFRSGRLKDYYGTANLNCILEGSMGIRISGIMDGVNTVNYVIIYNAVFKWVYYFGRLNWISHNCYSRDKKFYICSFIGLKLVMPGKLLLNYLKF